MGKVYDDWGRLVAAVVRREEIRQLCLQHSRTPSEVSSSSSSYQLEDAYASGDTALTLLHQQQLSLPFHSLSSAQMGMVRLQEDLISILNGEKQCFEPIHILDLHHPEHFTTPIPLNFIHPDRIPRIKSIAETMFSSGHEQEFRQAFIEFSKAAFTLYLTVLKMEEISSDVHRMEWKCLISNIRKWRLKMKFFIRFHLGCAKDAFNQILGEYRHINLTSFIESSQSSIASLLNFGLAIVTVPHKEPEWLFPFVDMYQDLTSVIPDINTLFPEEIGSFIRVKFHDLLTRLRDSAKVVLKELGFFFGSGTTVRASPRGTVHRLSKYAMSYILAFEDCGDTLNLLLAEESKEKMDGGPIADDGWNASSPLTVYVKSLTSVLEAKWDDMSNAYEDMSAKHIFMMNNIYYMVQKIVNSKLCTYFGDEWIRDHVGKLQHHAISYQRVTWNHVVSLLRCDDYRQRGSKATLKARCQAFTTAFEDVYESQTKLCVPHIQLRVELRLLAFHTVIHAYQCFLRRFSSSFGEKHVVYTDKDLQKYTRDLLKGSSKSLNRSRTRRIRFKFLMRST